MSQTAITLAFEQWKAQQGANNEPITLDEFVFASVPGLEPTAPVDRSETLPPAEQIVYRQAVSRKGVVNENAVVHSVVLGADVGDFSFNWIGLINKASGTLAMIVHAPTQLKLKNSAGQQGNVLTRSFLMEYTGAQNETAINTPAETWQIDFTARMAGMDERQRLENTDIYGTAAFLDDGWLVGKNGNQFFVTKGAGYVAGLRAELAANQNITVTTKPVRVWLDVCWTGALTSVWAVQSKVTVAASLVDYEQNGVKHYVFALASIDANGNITDLRPKGSLAEQQGRSDYLRKDANLSDVKDKTAARKSLGLESKLWGNNFDGSGSVDGTLTVKGNDADNAFFKLIQAATTTDGGYLAVGNSGRDKGYVEIGTIDDGDTAIHARKRKNDSSIISSVTLLDENNNSSFPGKVTLPQTSSFGINTTNALGGNSISIGDSDTGLKQNGDGNLELYANNAAIMTLNKSSVSVNSPFKANASVSVGNELNVAGTPNFNGTGYIVKNGLNSYSDNKGDHHQINGLHLQGTGNLYADIYHHELIGQYHELAFHVANGGIDGWFNFRNNGNFYASSNLHAGNAVYQDDGNLSGTAWGGYLSEWLKNNKADLNYVNNDNTPTANAAGRGAIDSRIEWWCQARNPGEPGSYAMLTTDNNPAYGSLVPGSICNGLQYCDASDQADTVNAPGNWRLMGAISNSSAAGGRTSLWLRIY